MPVLLCVALAGSVVWCEGLCFLLAVAKKKTDHVSALYLGESVDATRLTKKSTKRACCTRKNEKIELCTPSRIFFRLNDLTDTSSQRTGKKRLRGGIPPVNSP